MTLGLISSVAMILQGCMGHAPAEETPSFPAVDHHSHLISAEALSFLQEVAGLPSDTQPFAGDDLIAALDSANIQRAVVGSVGYFFASAYLPEGLSGEREWVQAENDWNARQAARHPGRLIAFCGLNPLSAYATEEVARCQELPHVAGIKMHFDNSGVDVLNSAHVAKLREVFGAANGYGLAVLVHLRVPRPDYGREHSRIFIEQILDAAPDVPIQVAHLAGSGPGYDADEAFLAFGEAFAGGDARLAHVYFDVASNIVEDATSDDLDLIAERLRMVGLERILFGSDYAGIMNEPPSAAWEAFGRLPLTAVEMRQITANVAPYTR